MFNAPKVTPGLEKLYQDWRPKGLLSLYAWGSAVTVDYNPSKSDLDIMGIISDEANEKDFAILDEIVRRYTPEANDPGLRVLYLSELRTGKPKSWMGGIIHPRLLLLDFPAWTHVAGQKFVRSDFPLRDLTPQEAVAFKLKEIYDRHYRAVGEKQEQAHYYYCKALYRVCYYLDQATNKYPFSYTALHASANPRIKPIVEPLEKLKHNHWDQALFDKAYPLFNQFITELHGEYS
ncbi:MAG TPA: hypothetical protein VLE93_00630 [Candidatus Saccharimonadales bacterium]|nr:hypothetical protein [Candidatus Saccharimonadales bacterium]